MWAGSATPSTAPFSVKMDGTITNVGNSYVQTAADNASNTNGVKMDVFFPDDVSAVDKCYLSVKFSAFRAYSTGAADGGSSQQTSSTVTEVEKTSYGGSGNTGGTASLTSGGPSIATTDATGQLITNSAGSGATGPATGTTAGTALSASVSAAVVSGDTSNPGSGGMSAAKNTGDGGTGATGAATGTTGASADLSTGGNDAFNTGSSGTGATGGKSVSISGATGFKTAEGSHNHAVGTLSGGSHTHTGPSHTHSVKSHTHPIGSHSHGMNSHTHTGPKHQHNITDHSHGGNGGVHSHTIAHTHSIAAHTHGLNDHTHTGPDHTHTIDGHNHFMPHTHKYSHTRRFTHKITLRTAVGHPPTLTGIYKGPQPQVLSMLMEH